MSTTSIPTAPVVPATPSRISAVLGWIIFGLSIVGMACSIVTLRNHYSTAENDYCDVAANFNCDIVNRSAFSKVGPAFFEPLPQAFGTHAASHAPAMCVAIGKLPVAAIGIAGYGLLMGLALFAKRSRCASLMVVLGALCGMGFALRLTYIEKYVLFTWCIFCLTSQIVIALILLISLWLAVRVWRQPAICK